MNANKLSNVVKNDVVKKDVYVKLVTKVHNINISGFVLKAKYDTDVSELENKIPDTINLVEKTDYNTKIIEIEDKIPDISNLTTKTELTIIEKKIPDINNLTTKTALTIVENKTPDISNLSTKTTLTTAENKVPNFSSQIKTDYNTKAAAIDTKISTLDGKITKNQSINKNYITFFGKYDN